MRFTCLSIVAPAGERIRNCLKILETRRWAPDHLPLRNLLIIENKTRLSRAGPNEDPYGSATALVDIVTVRPWLQTDLTATSSDTWEPGWLAWELSNIRPVSYLSHLPARRRLYELELDNALMQHLSL